MNPRSVRRVALLGGWLGLASTISCSGEAPEGVVDQCTGELTLPPSVSTDILFVIDNSNSMAEEQEKVVAELGSFVDSLASAPIENDFQVGVITTGVSLSGRASCKGKAEVIQFPKESGKLQLGKDLAGKAVSDSKRKILGFEDGDLVEQFALLVGQGVKGSGQEMGLEAMRRALDEELLSKSLDDGGNEGLLRPGARLLVVIVSDEDDCSDPTSKAVVLGPSCGDACEKDSECGGQGKYCVANEPTEPRQCQTNACETPEGRKALEPVKEYVDFLRNLDDGTGTGRKRDVYLAAIAPVDEAGAPKRCRNASDEAYGVGERYRDAVALMGDRGYIGSICSAEYGEILQHIATLVNAPQVVDLPNDPADGRLIRVQIQRKGKSPITCKQGDGFSFEKSVGSAPARLTMEGQCRLRNGDDLSIELFCAG